MKIKYIVQMELGREGHGSLFVPLITWIDMSTSNTYNAAKKYVAMLREDGEDREIRIVRHEEEPQDVVIVKYNETARSGGIRP